MTKQTPAKKHTMRVVLNGTKSNLYHQFGLTQNPFPSVAKAEWMPFIHQVQKLGGDPIPDIQYIRDTLKDFSPEFVKLCCDRFQIGSVVKFSVEFPE